MEINMDYFQHILIVRPAGELDMAVADHWRYLLDEALRRHGAKNLIINFSKVTFIDSSCLGVILGRYKKLAASGGQVLLTGIPDTIRSTLEVSGLLRLMKEFPHESEAIFYFELGGTLSATN